MIYRYAVNLKDITGPIGTVADDIYCNHEGSNILAVRAGTPLTPKVINMLKKQDIKSVYVNSKTPRKEPETGAEKIQPFPTPVSDSASAPAPAPAAPSVTVAAPAPPKPHIRPDLPKTVAKPMLDEEFREQAVDSIRNLFSLAGGTGSTGGIAPTDGTAPVGGNLTTAYQVIKGIDDVVDQLLETFTSDLTGFAHINDLKKYDEYTYHHSLSVAVLSIATGRVLNLESYELKNLARCAIMHDLGKITVPIEIINKTSKLTDEEFEIVKKHPREGALLLKAYNIGNTELWNAVQSHHEKFAGNGYPNGLSKNNIPLYSKIIAIADVYDAVTSFRPYRRPMAPCQAHDVLMSEVDRAFDYDVVKAFIERLVIYPINTVLEVTGERIGVVVDNINELRPVLKMQDNGETLDLANINNLSTMITCVHNPYEH